MRKAIQLLLSTVAAMLFVVTAFAQMTTSSLNGKVTTDDGEPAIGAAVVAVHEPSGTQYFAVINAEGRYTINGMRSGGPYTVEISCLGYQSVKVTDVTLQLAEASTVNAVLKDDSQQLAEAVVVSEAAHKFNTEKTGAATNISSKQITELPTISRSITDITKLSPYGGNGMSFAGSDGRTANFTVDGANFNNNFGLSDALPGGGSPISIDAIEEAQVVISPYDVRQANFIGGGVNAITKSGTNTFKGSAYVYHRNENMRGNSAAGQEINGAREKDRTTTYGATFGGPIIKNKLFFFANFEMSKVPTVVNRWQASDNGVANPDAYISRTKKSDLQAVADKLQRDYGYDAGSFTDFPANESNMKILGRIDWNINNNNHLAVRYNYTVNTAWNPTNASSSDCKSRATQGRLSQYGMSFANSLYSINNKVHTWSFDLNSRITDNLSNQFLATYSMLDDVRGTNSSPFPFIDILDGEAYQGGEYLPYISAGYELFTWKNAVHNRVLTAKDDITLFLGSHKITGGLSYEYQMADNAYMRNGSGYYRFASLNDFLNNNTPETINLTYGYNGDENPAARVRYHKASLYAQDEFNPTDRLKLTAGLRIETIIYDNRDVMRNNKIYDVDYNGYHVDTGTWPTPKVQVSPRVGFVWDVLGDQSLKFRGGTGLFTGRLPLVFFTNMPTNSNMVQMKGVISTGQTGATDKLASVWSASGNKMITDPAALRDIMNKVDPDSFPLSVSPETGVFSEGSSINGVDPKFKMPQVWKTSLAIDYAFPTSFPMSISAEGIFNKTVNGVCIQDYNIKPTEGFARFNGPDNRHIYPADNLYTKSSAFVLTNTNKGYGWSANVMFKMSPIQGLDLIASYTHTVQKELTGMPGSDASSAFTYIPTVEGPNNPVLHNSSYCEPDRAFVSLTYNDPANNHFSLFYDAFHGGYNYSYMYSNDMNGDGYQYDALYIPNTKNDIHFVSEADADRFWAFVEKDAYLSSHKGQYAEAYSVYSPWTHRLDFRYAHDFKIKIGKSVNTLQINFDVKNLLNIFNDSWGVMKQMNPSLNSGRILKYEKIDAEGYPVFSTPSAVSGSTDIWTYNKAIGQCWYAQIGLRYMFN